MTPLPLEEGYFRWLYGQVSDVRLRNPSRTYWSLLKLLHTKEFVWIVPNDDNRLEDGCQLRHEFLMDHEVWDMDPNWLSLGCSMLEMLIALSRHLAFEDDGKTAREWFWHMLENIGIAKLTDRHNWSEQDVEDILDNVIWRTYRPNGRGGLFPLKHANGDQREVELWYQLNAYLLENGG